MGSVEKRRSNTDLSDLKRPTLNQQERLEFARGVELFNRECFWEAHEEWEMVWQKKSENNRIFFQGLIQVAAGLHQLKKNIFHGVDKHLRNALWKIEPFRPSCLGLDIESLVKRLRTLHEEVVKLGPERMKEMNYQLPVLKIEGNSDS